METIRRILGKGPPPSSGIPLSVGMNSLVGVYGAPNPAMALAHVGTQPVWDDTQIAFGGSQVWTDRAHTVIVSGELILDNATDLRPKLGWPEAEPGELFAELYRRHGTDAGRYALGMFAVAVWEPQRRQLILFRDSVGARTLYYATDGRAWWFAGRLPSMRRCPVVSGEISLTALQNYLTFAFVPGADTLWSNVFEMRPGTSLTLPTGAFHSYWEPAEGESNPPELIETYARWLRELLEEAVRVRLPSSGPVGVFLSGGVDSSLVTALAARQAPERVHTYAIHFGPEHPNELAFSGLVAEHCGTHHHVLALSGEQMRKRLEETLYALDDPIGDPLTVPNFLLGEEAAQEVSVILNGEGGDPCFGGPKNQPMLLHELYSAGANREAAYLRSYQKCYDDLADLLTPEVQIALSKAQPQEALLTPFLTNLAMPHFLNKLMHMNLRLKGADQILTKVNNLTSANGLIGRSPLFDRSVVEASFAIPPMYKLAGAMEKAVLKRAVEDLLPGGILTRPKSGMLVPVQSWFKGELHRFAHGLLLDRQARIRPYLNQEVVREWLSYRNNLWPRHGVKLWLILTLEVWFRVHE